MEFCAAIAWLAVGKCGLVASRVRACADKAFQLSVGVSGTRCHKMEPNSNAERNWQIDVDHFHTL